MKVGDTFGNYTIIRALGRGGMGEVWVARDAKLDREVALKVLPDEYATDPVRRERFEREARAVAAINHPNIVTVHSIEESDGLHILIMELVEGATLVNSIPSAGMATEDFLELAIPLAEAIDAAHESGILHRDIKPTNIMVTPDGRPKILDFGLAKMRAGASPNSDEVAPDDETRVGIGRTSDQASLTDAGTVLGTTEYMAPEQLRGAPTDRRADMFSFGVVLYEMLTGRHPFRRGSGAETISAILKEPPEPLGNDVSARDAAVSGAIERLLAKNADDRPSSLREVTGQLQAQRSSLRNGTGGRRLGLPIAAAVAIAAVAATFFGYRYVANVERVRWATSEALPQARALAESGDILAAFDRAQEAEQSISGNSMLEDLFAEIAAPIEVVTSPPGAELYYRDPLQPEAEWRHVGTTPFATERFPRRRVRWRVEMAGFHTVEGIWRGQERELRALGEGPDGMVRIPDGNVGWTALINLGGMPNTSVPLDAFFIGRHEITNEQFKEFVEAGGYEEPRFWLHDFVDGGRVLDWKDAMATFVDPTGRPGPSTWRLGDYPEGQAQFPVGGVSWFEAAAYAEFAGASLPTVFHWTRAAGTGAASYIAPLSNLMGEGPEPVGDRDAISVFGVQDMAGNVREWCLNAVGGRRSILGGSWQDPVYMFGALNDLREPWDRSTTNGFRTASYPAGPDAGSDRELALVVRDYAEESPVSDEVFAIYREQFSYDRGELSASVETVDDGSQYWLHERIAFDAAYPGERVTADLYLPRDGRPPYQVVVRFPGSGAVSPTARKSGNIEFIVRSGRAVMYPSYKGTYDRADGETYTWPTETTRFRDDLIKWGKDLRRSIDYLESRDDIDADRVAFFGTSWGGRMGTIFPAVEPRIKAVILWVGGLASGIARPEVDQINYVTRVTQPALMLNGRFDPIEPHDTAQLAMARLLGAPAADKRHVVYETGHFLPTDASIRETLDWLNKYLGPVER